MPAPANIVHELRDRNHALKLPHLDVSPVFSPFKHYQNGVIFLVSSVERILSMIMLVSDWF